MGLGFTGLIRVQGFRPRLWRSRVAGIRALTCTINEQLPTSVPGNLTLGIEILEDLIDLGGSGA